MSNKHDELYRCRACGAEREFEFAPPLHVLFCCDRRMRWVSPKEQAAERKAEAEPAPDTPADEGVVEFIRAANQGLAAAEPEDHGIECGTCGETFDARELDQVFAHEHEGGPHLVTGIRGGRMSVEDTVPLLPCPFCGGEAEFERVGTPRQSCIVVCTECGGRLESSETFACGRSWNDRCTDARPVHAVVALLEDLLSRAQGGELRGMIAAFVCDEGAATGSAFELGDAEPGTMLLALERLKLRLVEGES